LAYDATDQWCLSQESRLMDPMDLRYFFDGAQCKEIVASAWLATMLQYDH
jgi:hypothetical protein